MLCGPNCRRLRTLNRDYGEKDETEHTKKMGENSGCTRAGNLMNVCGDPAVAPITGPQCSLTQEDQEPLRPLGPHEESWKHPQNQSPSTVMAHTTVLTSQRCSPTAWPQILELELDWNPPNTSPARWAPDHTVLHGKVHRRHYYTIQLWWDWVSGGCLTSIPPPYQYQDTSLCGLCGLVWAQPPVLKHHENKVDGDHSHVNI